VTFTDTSLGTITNRAWNFGDGFTTNLAGTNLSHTFTVAGTNLVSLVVSGTAGTSTNILPVVVTAPTAPPVIGGIKISGGNLILTGSNGTAGANYYVLAATNVALPVTNWIIVSTNQFGSGGNVIWTNPLNPVAPQWFYRLRLP
jgi:PKD repeat protein